ncbi:MAG: phytanoyl-CoA dioxygenase family protein [Chitinophagales bacterium]|nr:phytanoyl-CoA dioxygenase family protein [Bacteroidota bacterium]MCB9256498.1 phytanoyl-CoA dioxygenase family protein [Chitinophagales bacterium]
MRKVLNNEEWEKEFVKNGYVRIPFISEKEVAELKDLFFSTLPESGGQISSEETGVKDSHFISYDFTFIDKNPEYKRKVFKIISEYFQPHMERVLADFRPIIANYIRKKSETGEVPLHENWAFADEKKCTTVSIWCPLVDSTVENGTLQVVPGSQKRFGQFRGPMVPWELDGIKKEIIEKHLVPLETKAGDCVILDDSIVHYSAVNRTEGLRLAIQLICVPKEFPSIHYHLDMQNNSKEIQVLEVQDDFYMEFNPWKKPEGVKVIKKIPFENKTITEQEFVSRLKAPGFDHEESGLLAKIKRVFA